MIGAEDPHPGLDVEPVRRDRRVADRRDVRDVDAVDGDAGADADRAGVVCLAVRLRARVGVGLRLQADGAARSR